MWQSLWHYHQRCNLGLNAQLDVFSTRYVAHKRQNVSEYLVNCFVLPSRPLFNNLIGPKGEHRFNLPQSLKSFLGLAHTCFICIDQINIACELSCIYTFVWDKNRVKTIKSMLCVCQLAWACLTHCHLGEIHYLQSSKIFIICWTKSQCEPHFSHNISYQQFNYR